VVTKAATKTIRALAAATTQEVLNNAILMEMLSRTADAPVFFHRGARED
jgi:hypothetical protein